MKKVSVLIPCRNEEKFIKTVIEDLLKQTYPKEFMEIFFIDGRSEDSTRNIIQKYEKKYNFIKLVDNPYKYVPHALNLGIRKAKGDIIIRMDAHSSYPPEYIEKLVYWLEKLNADNVGGIWDIKPRNNSLKGKAIALVLSHPFGVGNSKFRILSNLKKPIEVDTVPFGCYKREVFNKIGLFDERLIRNQDLEFNKRLKKNGGKIYLVPIKLIYFARSNWKELWDNNFKNGKWVILTIHYTKDYKSISLRHFIPLLFIIYLFVSLLSFPLLHSFLLFLPILTYLLLVLGFSLKLGLKQKSVKLIPYTIISFVVLHISYGLGSLYGLLVIILTYMRSLFFSINKKLFSSNK